MNATIKGALLSVSLLVVSAGAIAGNIPTIIKDYPTIPPTFIELLTTIPSLFIILTVFISPAIARRIGYKITVQLGILLLLTGGILPLVTSSFFSLFFSRILFGIGVGLFNPLLYTLATSLYKGEELASVIGLQSACEGIGGMLITFLIGQLLAITWRVSFSVYLIAIPILMIFTLFVPNITPTIKEEKVKNSYEKIAPYLVGYFILLGIAIIVYMSLAVKVTAFFGAKGIGNGTTGSNFLALVGFGSMLAGVLFGKTIGVLKKWTLPASFFLLGFALFLLAYAENSLSAFAAAILAGLAFRTFVPYVFNIVNQRVENRERNTSYLLIILNLGTALAPVVLALFYQLIPDLDEMGLFMGEGWSMIGLGAVLLLINIKKEKSVDFISG